MSKVPYKTSLKFVINDWSPQEGRETENLKKMHRIEREFEDY